MIVFYAMRLRLISRTRISGHGENGMRCASLLGLALSICFTTAAIGQPPATSDVKSERFAADTPLTTTSGATFTAPAGWSVTSGPNKRVLDPPEADSRLAVVDVQASDAAGAVAAGWAGYRPDANRPLRITTRQAPSNGWDERHLYSYETSPNERAVVYALALRAGQSWTVVIVEATRATFEKRNAALSLAVGSLRPKGYQRELFTERKARPLDAEWIALLKDFVQDVMRQLGIPGVGLSLIDGGKVVYEGGLGVKAIGNPDPVDADTLFLAASNTKAMTTLLLARLVDEHKLRWDQPVTEIYPVFKLGNAETSRQVLVRHLICACTGMPRQDLEWLFNFGAATPTSMLALLGTMRPTSGFGEVYQYSKLMAAAAGFIGASLVYPGKELGAAYDEALRSKVFEPLGMTRTTFDFATAMRGNFASPHGIDVDGKTMVSHMDANYSVVPLRPTGGMWTSVRDLSKYLQMELALGMLPDGTRLVSKESLLERRKRQVATGEHATYGMGLLVNMQYGIPVVHHGGSMFGYKSDMIFLPDHCVGAVILTNADSGGSLSALFRRRLLEVLFDGKPEAVEQAKVTAAQRIANIAKSRERLVVPADVAEVGKLATRYASPALGTLQVRTENGATIFDFGKWQSVVASRKNDDGTISFVTVDSSVGGYNFVVGQRDGKRALIIRDAQHEYAFVDAASP
jgi:CubicO group peptidase (beta-lactamase class C family)